MWLSAFSRTASATTPQTSTSVARAGRIHVAGVHGAGGHTTIDPARCSCPSGIRLKPLEPHRVGQANLATDRTIGRPRDCAEAAKIARLSRGGDDWVTDRDPASDDVWCERRSTTRRAAPDRTSRAGSRDRPMPRWRAPRACAGFVPPDRAEQQAGSAGGKNRFSGGCAASADTDPSDYAVEPTSTGSNGCWMTPELPRTPQRRSPRVRTT